MLRSYRGNLAKQFANAKKEDVSKWVLWPEPEVQNEVRRGPAQTSAKRNARRSAARVSERARKAKNGGWVINLSNVDVPDEVFALLARGPGFIPTPRFNRTRTQLDALHHSNQVGWRVFFHKQKSGDGDSSHGNDDNDVLPPQLYVKTNRRAPEIDDCFVEDYRRLAVEFANTVNPERMRDNLSWKEKKALKWLRKQVEDNNLVVSEADKGGAILLLDPNHVHESVTNRLSSDDFELLGPVDQLDLITQGLRALWASGVEKQFVSADIRERVLGITSSGGCKATQAYRSSPPYAYPLFKIHKVKPEDLVPGVRPPIRLVTAQRNGPTSRSDKYLMLKILQDVQNEYCTDLVKDSTDALIRLNGWFPIAESQPFALDVVALYDSINPSLAIEALDCALRQCRPQWSHEYLNWLKELVKHTICNNKFMYKGNWYLTKKGIPTGGVLSPLLANITMT